MEIINQKSRRDRGFTIVELLIVIVVIAILAAITIVAYNGIQNRAKSNQMVSGMVQYVKALSMYTSDKNAYPIQTGYIACFGGVNDCNGTANAAQTALLASELAPYTNNTSSTLLASKGALINSITNYIMPDGSNFTGMYIYFLQYGTTTCPSVGGVRFMYSSPSGVDVVCRYALPIVS
jgi:prepilin-type N-terminal cleavage/methylation domain-containing protein